MTRTDRFGTADLMLVLLCLILASAARFGYLALYADWGRADPPLIVENEPPELPDLIKHWSEENVFACRAPLAEGVERTAHTGPAYSWLIAKMIRYLPDQFKRNLRFVQAALGALAAMFYYLIAFRAWGNRVAAFLAGLFCSLYLPWVVQPAQLTDGTLVAFLLALALWLAGRAAEEAGPISGLLLGLTLGALALTRPELVLLSLGMTVWLVWRCIRLPSGWLAAVLVIFGLAGSLAPWTIRNYQEFQGLIGVSSAPPLHYCVGAGPGATGGPRLEEALLSSVAQTVNEPKPQLATRLARTPQKERYNELGRLAWETTRADPVAWIHQRLRAFLGFWLGDDWLQDRRLWHDAAGAQPLPGWFPVAFTGSLAALLALALLGWRWSFVRRGTVPVTLTPLLIALPYVLTHADSLAGPRLPLDGLLLALAAFTIACLVPRLGPWSAGDEERIEKVWRGPSPVPPPPPPPRPSPSPPRQGEGGYSIRI